MTYYNEKRKFNRWLEKAIKGSKQAKIAEITYQATNLFDIGEKSVKTRLELLERLGMIEIRDDEARWLGKEKLSEQS